MRIADFFNPYDKNHLKAYEHLQDVGFWPEGFIPKDVEFTTAWQVEISMKIANAWIKFVMNFDLF